MIDRLPVEPEDGDIGTISTDGLEHLRHVVHFFFTIGSAGTGALYVQPLRADQGGKQQGEQNRGTTKDDLPLHGYLYQVNCIQGGD
jgi:hypothetical protein